MNITDFTTIQYYSNFMGMGHPVEALPCRFVERFKFSPEPFYHEIVLIESIGNSSILLSDQDVLNTIFNDKENANFAQVAYFNSQVLRQEKLLEKSRQNLDEANEILARRL